MRNTELWRPTNIIPIEDGRWQANPEHVAPWSRHVTSLEVPAYIETIGRFAHGDLVDIGSGTVPYYGVYKDMVDSVTTVDWPNSLHDSQYVDIFADANQPLPLESQAYDTVLLADVLEHIMNPASLIAESSRVLRPNGNIILFVPFMYGIHEAPHDYHRYTKFSLEVMAESNGLRTIELEAFGGGPDVVIDLLEKMTYESSLARIATTAARLAFIKTVVYKNLQNKYKNRFPIGYSFVATKLA